MSGGEGETHRHIDRRRHTVIQTDTDILGYSGKKKKMLKFDTVVLSIILVADAVHI